MPELVGPYSEQITEAEVLKVVLSYLSYFAYSSAPDGPGQVSSRQKCLGWQELSVLKGFIQVDRSRNYRVFYKLTDHAIIEKRHLTVRKPSKGFQKESLQSLLQVQIRCKSDRSAECQEQ